MDLIYKLWSIAFTGFVLSLIFMAIVVALSGCAMQREYYQRVAAEEDTRCISFGYERGSGPYNQCRWQMAQAREAQRNAELAQIAAASRALSTPAPTTIPSRTYNPITNPDCIGCKP